MQLNAAVARPGAARSLSFPRGARPRAPISATHRHREKFDDSMKRRADRTSTQRLLDVQDVKQQAAKDQVRADWRPDPAHPRCALFDLDDTLIDINSGYLWTMREWRVGRIRWHEVWIAIITMFKYMLGYTDSVDKVIHEAAKTYAGLSSEVLRHETKEWFMEEVAPRMRPKAAAVLAFHREQGERCILASSTSQYAAECAVQVFQLDDAVSSRLEVGDDGLLTGRVAKLAYGRKKADALKEWAEKHKVPLSNCTFYSDSYADRTLLSEVGRAVAVNPDRRLRALARANGWEIVDWGKSARGRGKSFWH